MNTPLPPSYRKVSLRLASGTNEPKAMPAESMEALLARASARHSDSVDHQQIPIPNY